MRSMRLAVVVLAGMAVMACSKATTAPTAATGTVTVHVNATGTSVDSVFSVTVDGTFSYSVTTGQDQSFQVDGLNHSITLGDVASNCEVTSTNPQIVQVDPDAEKALTFDVTCSTNGNVAVTLATTGDNQDDQYLLSFNSDFYQVPVGPRQTLNVSLPVDTYVVELSGVASNCAVQSDNPVTVDVVQDSTVTARFDIACSAP